MIGGIAAGVVGAVVIVAVVGWLNWRSKNANKPSSTEELIETTEVQQAHHQPPVPHMVQYQPMNV